MSNSLTQVRRPKVLAICGLAVAVLGLFQVYLGDSVLRWLAVSQVLVGLLMAAMGITSWRREAREGRR